MSENLGPFKQGPEQPRQVGTVEENLELVTFIQLSRIYDVLMALFQETAPEKAEVLFDMHSRGDFLTPAPAIAHDDEHAHPEEE